MPDLLQTSDNVFGPPSADPWEMSALSNSQPSASSDVFVGGLHILASRPSTEENLFDDQSLSTVERMIAKSIEATKYRDLREPTTQNIDQHFSKNQGPELNQIKKWALWQGSQDWSEANAGTHVAKFGSVSGLIVNSPPSYIVFYEPKLQGAYTAVSQLRLIQASWYEEACQDLAELHLEASEEGLEPPQTSTQELARDMLSLLSKKYDQLPDVQPMRNGSIGIKFENRDQDSSVLFVIERGGSGVMFVRINGIPDRLRASDATKILRLGGGYHAMDEAGIRRI